MLIRESILRKLIQETLLLEVKKLNELKENMILYELFNEQFNVLNPSYDLNNQKSPGRYFSEILYASMKYLNSSNNFSKEGKPLNLNNLKSKVYSFCEQIVFLYKKKEITSKTVNYTLENGNIATFKEYINEFNQKFMSPKFQGDNILEKIEFVCSQMNENISFANPESVISNLKKIKQSETKYPFGENAVVDEKYRVVCPQTIPASIFWARSNYEGKEIVLPELGDISWCTGRYKGNWFNTYFIGFGANLYYFLPVDDVRGTRKMCIGLFKEVDKKTGEQKVYIGNSMGVNFKNQSFFKNEKTELNEENIKILSAKAEISPETIRHLIDDMSDKSPRDLFKVVSMMDLEQFKSVTNLNSIAPRMKDRHGFRDPDHLQVIFGQIARLLNTYIDPKYSEQYAIHKDILDYCVKMWPIWTDEGITQLNNNGFISILYKLVPGLSTNKDFVMSFIDSTPECYKYLDTSLKDDEELVNYLIDHRHAHRIKFSDKIRNNRELMLKDYRKNPYKNIDFLGEDLLNDISFIKELIKNAPDIFHEDKILNLCLNHRELILERIKDKPYDFCLSKINSIYKNDFEIAMEAVTRDLDTIISIGKDLKNNLDFCTQLYLKKPEYFNKLNFTKDEFIMLSNKQKSNIIVLRDIYQNVDFKKVKAIQKQNQNGQEKNVGFFNNITNKVKRFFKGNNTNEGRIIRISENELRKIIRGEILR